MKATPSREAATFGFITNVPIPLPPDREYDEIEDILRADKIRQEHDRLARLAQRKRDEEIERKRQIEIEKNKLKNRSKSFTFDYDGNMILSKHSKNEFPDIQANLGFQVGVGGGNGDPSNERGRKQETQGKIQIEHAIPIHVKLESTSQQSQKRMDEIDQREKLHAILQPSVKELLYKEMKPSIGVRFLGEKDVEKGGVSYGLHEKGKLKVDNFDGYYDPQINNVSTIMTRKQFNSFVDDSGSYCRDKSIAEDRRKAQRLSESAGRTDMYSSSIKNQHMPSRIRCSRHQPGNYSFVFRPILNTASNTLGNKSFDVQKSARTLSNDRQTNRSLFQGTNSRDHSLGDITIISQKEFTYMLE